MCDVCGSQVFPRFVPGALFASSFDWFTGLPVSFLIGQSVYFGYRFRTLNRKSP